MMEPVEEVYEPTYKDIGVMAQSPLVQGIEASNHKDTKQETARFDTGVQAEINIKDEEVFASRNDEKPEKLDSIIS